MRLSTRVSAGILVLVAVSTLAIWTMTMHGILHPFARSVFLAFQDEAVFVAERVDAGEKPVQVGEDLGLRVWRVKGEPREAFRGRRHRGPVEGEVRDGREILSRAGPRNVILVNTDHGWIGVSRDLDLERPGRHFGVALLAGLLASLLAAWALGRASVRPLQTAQRGMDRIAAGDLEHRIPEEGPLEIARMAASFNTMADRIDTLLRTERQLLAGVSHELRTPLARLRLELELLRDSGAATKRMDAMEGDLVELDGLISQLLTLSRMQLGDTPLSLQDTALRALVDEAISVAQLPAVAVLGEAQRSVDPALMVRAVVNLLSNAERYGGAPIEVVLSSDRLVVQDRGPGVADSDLEHLFDVFWRAEGSRARKTGGLGLGLMLVKQVAELHGATVQASNREGGGLAIAIVWS